MSFFIPMALGALGGALFNKQDPLKGAMMGAAGGAAGGLLGPALGVATGATGTAGAATGMGGTAGITGAGGLFASPIEHVGAATSLGTDIGTQQTAQLAEQNLFAEPAGMFGKTGDFISKSMEIAKPVMTGIDAAKAITPEQAHISVPSAPRMNSGPPDLSGVLALGQRKREYSQQMADLRRKEQQAMVGRMFG